MRPELMYGGVHGDDAVEVSREFNEVIEEVIEIYKINHSGHEKRTGLLCVLSITKPHCQPWLNNRRQQVPHLERSC